jgi:putative glycosyltransferase (TIGR04372 family)
MITKYYLLWIKLIFLLPIILVFLIFRIFLNIRIGNIETSVFGHMLIPIEIFLCEKKNKKESSIVFWFPEKNISNKYILDKWKKKLLVFPRHILEPIYIFFSFFSFSKNFIYFANEKNPVGKILVSPGKKIDDSELLQQYDPFINFTKKEISDAEMILSEFNISQYKAIICFAGRSKSYKSETFETARNSNVLNQLNGINKLVDQGYIAFRLGTKEQIKLPKNYPNQVIDFAFSSKRSDFLDLYLVSKCLFFISSQSGINEMATIMRKKKVIIDFIDFESLYLQNLFYIPIILPKKIYSKKKNNFLPYKEIFNFPFKEINNLEKLKDKNFEIIDNSPKEIEEAILNMDNCIRGELDLKKELKNQKEFWDIFNVNYGFRPKQTIICPSFFHANLDLFN